MKRIIILIILTFNILLVKAQSLQSKYSFENIYDFSNFFLKKYVSLDVEERFGFVKWLFTNDSLVVKTKLNGIDLFIVQNGSMPHDFNTWFINDLENLLGVKIGVEIPWDDSGCHTISESNKITFTTRITDLMKESLKKGYINYKKEYHEFDYDYNCTSFSIYPYLDDYFENSIENRITYIENNYKCIDINVLEIMRTDLDTLLSIKTTDYIIKDKYFIDKYVKRWREKLGKLKKPTND